MDDCVTEDNPVRVIEVFIDELDLGGLGFAGVHPAATGRPAYHPSTLLKIYLYGYLATGCQDLTALADRGYFNGGAGTGL